MASYIIMPKQGQSVESCLLTELKKKNGDKVSKGELLFAYETDKAAFEEMAQVDGVVLELYYNEGDEVPVLKTVMVIGEAGEKFEAAADAPVSAVDPKPASEEESPVVRSAAQVEVGVETKLSTVAQQEAVVVDMEGFKISPRAKKIAEGLGLNQKEQIAQQLAAAGIAGTGPGGRVIASDIGLLIERYGKLTPLARQLLNEVGGSSVAAGTGLAGTRTAADLRTAQVTEASASAFYINPLSKMRKIIARAMFASLQNSAQITHHLSADASRILELRAAVKKAMEEGFTANITLNDMVCFATVKALKQYPQINAQLFGDESRQFHGVHLGLAVDTERGLMVPVVKNADSLNIVELSNQLKTLAQACKKGNIDPDLLSAETASFTVTNLGNYGVEMFTPIINLPQVAILGVNTIVLRPKDLGNGGFGFIPHIGLSLTYDHRALDGGEASRFLKQIAIELENLKFEFH